MSILTSLPCHSIKIYSHHSNIIPISFWCHFIVQDLTYFWLWHEPRMKQIVVAGSFCFRRSRNEALSSFEGMTGTWSERPSVFEKGGPNGEEGRSNDLGFTVIPFFIPVVRTTFLVRGSFWVIPKRQEVLEWPPNEVKTRRGVGKKSGDFPSLKCNMGDAFWLCNPLGWTVGWLLVLFYHLHWAVATSSP